MEGFRLSPQQRRIWETDRFREETARVTWAAIAFDGGVDAVLLQEILSALLRRIEVFRTSLLPLPGLTMPLQVVNPPPAVELLRIDLTGLPQEARKRERADACGAHARGAAAGSSGFRCALISTDGAIHTLSLALPASCADHQTLKNIFNFIARHYSAGTPGELEPGASADPQYIDYSNWLNGLPEVPEAAAGFAYWRDAFRRAPLPSPGRVMVSNQEPFSWDTFRFRLPGDLEQRLAGRTADGPEEVLLAIWYSFVSRFAGADGALGVFLDGRGENLPAELMGPVGMVCPLSPDLRGAGTLSRSAGIVRELLVLHRDWQDCFRWDDRPRGVAYFPVAFEYRLEDCRPAGGQAGMKLSSAEVCAEPFDLKLAVLHHESGCVLELAFRPAVCARDEIEAMAGDFLDHCRGALETNRCVFRPGPGRVGAYVAGAVGSADAPAVPVHRIFERWARVKPGAACLSCDGETLTFAEVNDRANALAADLRDSNISPDAVVAIYLETQPEAIIALLGVLKAGAAYLPLDCAAPPPRTEELIEAAGAKIVITRPEFADRFPSVRTTVLSRSGRSAVPDVYVNIAPDNLAYLLFTSGSTGKPKPVLIEHRQLSNYVLAVSERLHLEPEWRFAYVSCLAADLGNTSLFGALCHGGCLHLIPRERVTDGKWLAAYFKSSAVDVLKIVPSHLRALLQSTTEARALLPRQALILGGERLDRELAQALFALRPSCRIFNHYGPTETTVGVTADMVPLDIAMAEAAVPIGRPLANVRIFLLDPLWHPVPFGFSGELCIGGAQVGRGYLHRPEATAERFIPDFLSDVPGQRAYRTGDRVRLARDGSATWLGRIDDEIKIRGYRVDPGEVNGRLETFPEIQKSLVLSVEIGANEPALVAFVVPREAGRVLAMAEVKEYLKRFLPDYMVPSRFVCLESFPLTPNGKIDRQGLQRLAQAQPPEHSAADPAFSNPVAEILGGMWRDILKKPVTGVCDNFFELGGHSLSAMQLLARIRDFFGVELPLKAIFESPTIAELSPRILAARNPAAARPPGRIQPRQAGEPLVLSFAQERLWFFDRLEPNSSNYNIPAFARVLGRLNPSLLERSLQFLVRRQEILRSNILAGEDGPGLVIHEHQHFAVSHIDLSGLAPDRHADERTRLAGAQAQAPFNLAADWLIRVALLEFSPEEWAILGIVHHIVADAQSLGVLLREFSTIYSSLVDDRPPGTLPALPVQYADYAIWQRAWLNPEALEPELNFWRGKLRGAPQISPLPTDFPRGRFLTYASGRVQSSLTGAVVVEIRQKAAEWGLTMPMFLLALFKLLLFRITDERDLVVGTPVANRNRSETENLMGFFVNTLVLRTTVDPDWSWLELVAAVRRDFIDCLSHQEVPFERLVQDVQPSRSLSLNPLFQILFLHYADSGLQLALPQLRCEVLGVESPVNFDLAFGCQEAGDCLNLRWIYNRHLFKPERIEQWNRLFEQALVQVLKDPSRRVSAIDLDGEGERRAAVRPGERIEFPPRWIHAEIAERARRYSNGAAVRFEQRELSYAELDRWSNQVANFLRRQGLATEQFVGVCMERSVELVVVLLGILKAGGVYVPVDPDYPAERIQFLLEDAGAGWIMAQEKFSGPLAGGAAGRTVVLEESWGEIARESGVWIDPPALAGDNAAYMIYTSGSTGRPKGAVNTHAGIANRLHWMQRQYGLEPGERVLQKTPFSFDVSVWEFFWPLMTGATLVVARPGGHRDSGYLARIIREENITTAHFVPSMLQVFLDEPGADACRSLSRVICSGEALTPELEKRFHERLPHACLHNLYGPTEAAVDVTFWPCLPGSGLATVPIGYPIANMDLYVLDEELWLRPPGRDGKLYISGVGLARGYHGKPDLTAARFLPDPHSAAPGARMYRTGDVGRCRPDGALEFLGRDDGQIKIRGVRIEIGELEAALRRFPGVKEAAVVVREDRGEKDLIAYVSGIDNPGKPALRSFLRESLPDYLLPAETIVLAAMPLSANGKLDRKMLPVPPRAASTSAGEAEPRTPIEHELAALWRELLGVPRIGIHDNFFELGGHSLLLTRLASRLRKQLNIDLSLKQLFDAPTISELTSLIMAGEMAADEQGTIERLLQEVAELPPDEVSRQLESAGAKEGTRG